MAVKRPSTDGNHKYPALFTLANGERSFSMLPEFDRMIVFRDAFSGKARHEDRPGEKSGVIL